MTTVTVTGTAANGDGVARLRDGRAVFIRGAACGDVCEIAVTGEKAKSCRGEIVRLLTPSPHRIEPDCPAYRECGGCDFRHITYEEELRVKLQRVNDALERIGRLSVRAGEILTTGQTDGYRNKAVFHTARRDGGTVTGFYRSGSHEVFAVERCLLLKDELNGALAAPAGEGDLFLRAGKYGLQDPVIEELDGLIFQMSPKSFFQVNTGAALLLYQKAREYAALTKEDRLADLYCGVGALTLFLGRDAGFALGVDIEPSAVADARENARRNGISAEFIRADAGGAALLLPQGGADCVTADPPRKGLSAQAIRNILALSPGRIVYISCDPATLARDAGLFGGYEARRVCAVDMFPRTANVECVMLLEKK